MCYHLLTYHCNKISITQRKESPMLKVTMQDIADALGISRVTVWKTFNQKPGVSDEMKDRIIEKAHELGYDKFTYELHRMNNPQSKTVALVVSRPDSSVFWTNIIHHMAQELSASNINLMYTYAPTTCTSEYELPEILKGDSIQGIVVLNIYDRHLLTLLNELEVPKVFLDTVPGIELKTLTGDLLLIEGKYTVKQVVDHLLEKGCQRIGFIGDVNYALTNTDRYLGYLESLTAHGIPLPESLCFTGSIGIEDYGECIYRFLENLDPSVDAIVCVSDYVAHYVEIFLQQHPHHFSHDILLAGFDCSLEYPNIVNKVTTVDVKNRLLGKRLAVQIAFRMNHPDAPPETTYIRYKIIYSDILLPSGHKL